MADPRQPAASSGQRIAAGRIFVFTALRAIVAYTSVVLVHEGILRATYVQRAWAVTANAEKRRATVGDEAAARWAVGARNDLKKEIRDEGNPLSMELAEKRNEEKYGNAIGPTFETLAAENTAQGIGRAETPERIIGSAGRSNAAVNRSAAILGFIGAVLFVAYWFVVLRVAIKRRRTSGLLVEVILFVLAVIGGAAGMYLLAPVDLAQGVIADDVILDIFGAAIGAFTLALAAQKILRSGRTLIDDSREADHGRASG